MLIAIITPRPWTGLDENMVWLTLGHWFLQRSDLDKRERRSREEEFENAPGDGRGAVALEGLCGEADRSRSLLDIEARARSGPKGVLRKQKEEI